jgi:hypothetical protein
MATLAELEQRRQALDTEIAQLEARILADRKQIGLYDTRLAVPGLPEAKRKEFTDGINTLLKRIDEDGASIRRLELERDEVKSLIAGIQQAPVQSTGQTVREDSQGRQEASNATTPTAGQVQVGPDGRVKKPETASNATRPSTVPSSGTDDPNRPLKATQGRATITAEPGPARPSPSGPFPGQERGVGAGNDDSGSNATTQRLNAIFGGDLGQIITQPNILDEYLTYTYNISIYIMSPGQYQTLMATKKKNLAGFQLLMRSGGAPLTSGEVQDIGVTDPGEIPGVTTQSLLASGRNQFFPLDYYIDDVRMRSVIQGKGSGGAHNVVELNFKIHEPNGISLIQNLQKAAAQIAQLSGKSGPQNYAAQLYLMVIRFYGQDPDGNQVPVKGARLDKNGQPLGKPEVIEKFIPFLFTGIKFRVVQKVTEYECSAACPQNYVNTGRGRGVIPYNVEITSKTLKDLFAGKLGYSTTQQTTNSEGRQAQQADVRRVDNAISAQARATDRSTPSGLTGSLFNLELGIPDVSAAPVVVAGSSPTQNTAPPKADATAIPTINQGLFEALNKYQRDQVKLGRQDHADEYEIEIDPILAQAQVVPPGEINKTYTSMSTGQTARDKKDPATNRMDTTVKNTSARAGTSIVQFIDQYTRTSTYVYDQQIVNYDPRTGEPTIRPYIPGQVVAWYHIGLQAEPKLDQWDAQRRDYAYRIKFSLIPYQINDLKSDYFPQGRYQGSHKSYDFWFTGQNSQIINFEQDFNYLYYLVINNPDPTRATGQTTNYNQYRDEIRRFYQPNSDQSSQGIQGKVNEPSANAADYLYSPADQARVKMTIVGDPAWIQQGELWSGVSGLGFGDAFLNDGTISFDNREILFDIAFNTPVDYDLDNGLMDVGARNTGANRGQNQPGRAQQNYIYRAIEVTSNFSRGQFTQDLEGVLLQFDLARNNQVANSGLSSEPNERSPFVGGPDQSDAETRRLQAAQNQARFGGTTFADRANRAGATISNARRQQLTDLSTALRGEVPPTVSGLENEGFFAPAPAADPPTSSGISVGPAAAPTSLFGSYGALGTDTGAPAVTFTTQTGRVVTVTSEDDLKEAFNQGFINRVTQNELRRQLNQLQQQANSPSTNRSSQSIVREP